MINNNFFFSYIERIKTNWLPIVVIFMFSLSSLFLNNYKIGIGDHIIYLPYIENIKNGTFMNDDILKLFSGRATFFFIYFGWLFKIFSPEYVLLSLQLISVFLFHLSLYYIARFFIKNKYTALLILLFFNETKVTLGFITDFNYDHFLIRNLATPMFLFSLGLLLRNKKRKSIIFSATGLSIHILSGIHVFILFLGYFLFRSVKNKKLFISDKFYTDPLTLFLITHSPIFIYKFFIAETYFDNPIIKFDSRYYEYVKNILGSFLDPSSSQYMISFEFGITMIVIGLYCFYQIIATYKKNSKVDNIFTYIFVYVAFIIICNHIIISYIPHTLALQLQLIRFSKTLLILTTLFTAIYLIKNRDVKNLYWWFTSVSLIVGLQHVYTAVVFVSYLFSKSLTNKYTKYTLLSLLILWGLNNNIYNKIPEKTLKSNPSLNFRYTTDYPEIKDHFNQLDKQSLLILTTPSTPNHKDPRLEFNVPVYFTFSEVVEITINYGLHSELEEKLEKLNFSLIEEIRNGESVYNRDIYKNKILELTKQDLTTISAQEGITHVIIDEELDVDLPIVIKEKDLYVYKITE